MADAKRFTIDEANALIPRLEMLMERAQRAARVLRAALGDDDDAAPRSTVDVLRARPDLAPHVHGLEQAVGEIEDLGCEFKGLELGLVDFPAEVDGTVVLLCWQYGEKQIAYWHRAEEGFAGRRPLGSTELPQLQ
jgi:hypothetical protein